MYDGLEEDLGQFGFSPVPPAVLRKNALRGITAPPLTPQQSLAPQVPTPQSFNPQIQQMQDQAANYQQQGIDLMAQKPDVSAFQRYAKQRAGQGADDAVMAMAAQRAGMKDVGQSLFKRSLEAQNPIAAGKAGMVTPEGEFMEDPTQGKEQRINLLLSTATKYEQMAARSVDAQQRAQAAQQAAQLRQDAQQERMQLQRELGLMRVGQAQAAQGMRQDQNQWRFEDSMGKQFDSLSKNYNEELNATQKVAQLAPGMLGRRPTAIEQQSMIVLLNKFLDPNSVVREGEFDRVAKAQGLVDRASNLINRLGHGELMSDHLINQIVQMSKFYEGAARKRIQALGDEYVAKAERRGIDPTSVITSPYYDWSKKGQSGPKPIRVSRDTPTASPDQSNVVNVDW